MAAFPWTDAISSLYLQPDQSDDELEALLPEPSTLLKELRGATLPSATASRDICGHDHLSWHGSRMVWSRGNRLHRAYDFGEAILQACFAWFDVPEDARSERAKDASQREKLFGPFVEAAPGPWSENGQSRAYSSKPSKPIRNPVSSICVFLRDALQIHFLISGRTYTVHMPFRLKKAWPAHRGLILERHQDVKESAEHLPLVYSLTDPHDEIRPLSQTASLSANPAPSPVRPFSDPSHPILLLSRSDWSVFVTFDVRKRTVSLWLTSALSPAQLQTAILKAQTQSTAAPKATGSSSDPNASIINADVSMLDAPRTTRKPSGSKKTRVDAADRETSFIMHGDDDQREQVGVLPQVFAQKVWQSGPSMTLTDFGNTDAFLFDEREAEAILAIHSRSSSILFLFRLNRPTPFQINVSELAVHSARSAACVLSTRPNLRDLFIIQKGKPIVLSSFGAPLPLAIPKAQNLATIDASGFSWIECHTADNAKLQLDVEQQPRHHIVQQCFETLSLVLPHNVFLMLYGAFLKERQRDQSIADKEPDVFVALLHGLASRLAGGAVPPPNAASAWDRLRAARRQDAAFPQGQTLTSQAAATTVVWDLDVTGFRSKDLEAILLGMHLVYEDLSLLPQHWRLLPMLNGVLHALATAAGFLDWQEHYARHGYVSSLPTSGLGFVKERKLCAPPDLPSALASRLTANQNVLEFPEPAAVAPTDTASAFFGPVEPCRLTRQLLRLYDLFNPSDAALTAQSRSHAVVKAMHDFGWTRQLVEQLALGPALPLWEALRTCTESPPAEWDRRAYLLIDRKDLAAHKGQKLLRIAYPYRPTWDIAQFCKKIPVSKAVKRQKAKDQNRLAKSLPVFHDRRLEEVNRLLRWTKSSTITMPGATEGSEVPNDDVQADFCLNVAARTQALPIGEALFSFRTKPPSSNELAKAPEINLGVHIVPFGLHLELSTESFPPERKHWPDFHAGVSAALEKATTAQFDYTEITYNRPNELNARHAGYLFGLGLGGQMRSMAVYQAFAYLDPKHELTSIGVLLGLSAAHISTCDAKITSVLAVHLSALHPPHSADLQLTLLTQAAGILGLGLLYLGTKKRHIADILIREFTKMTVRNMEQAELHRETYALMTGFAFGMVMLGEGNAKAGMGDTQLLRQFRMFLDGDGQSPLPGSKKGVQPAVDVNLTSPAAAVALALMYLGTGRHDVIDLLQIPQSIDRLDYIRPSLIMHRVIGRALVALPLVECTAVWISSQVPPFLQRAKDKSGISLAHKMTSDQESAYWSVIAGGCFAIGLKFAGTASAEAHTLLLGYYDQLGKSVTAKGRNLQQRLKRYTLQSCINTICLALCMIFAGTGDLQIMQRLRVAHGKLGEAFDYGTHMATHMSLGLLFFGNGRYTLSTKPAALAALYLAFYPAFPSDSSDNRSHLQAARHLWILASEPRCLIVKDVGSRQLVQVPFKLRLFDNDHRTTYGSTRLTAPSLIPDLDRVHSIKVEGPRYHAIEVQLDAGENRSRMVDSRTVFVKKRAGCLDYRLDPAGVRGLDAIPGGEASSVSDLGQSTMDVMPQIQQGMLAKYTLDLRVRGWFKVSSSAGLPASEKDVFLQSVFAECLREDKLEAMLMYHQLFTATRPRSTNLPLLRQNAAVRNFYASLTWLRLFSDSMKTTRLPLVGRAFVEHLVRKEAADLRSQLDGLVEPGLTGRDAVLGTLKNGIQAPLGSVCRLLLALQCPPMPVVQRLRAKVTEVLGNAIADDRAALEQSVLLVIQKVLDASTPSGYHTELASLILASCQP